MSTKRNLRPRSASQYASQQEWNLDEDDVLSIRRFNAVDKFKEEKFNVDHGLVREMKGEEFTLRWVQEHGLTHPLVFRESKGLGMKLPQGEFTVQDVKRLVGPRRVVDVMDTRTQEASTMTLSQWTKYYCTKPRQKILNVISLEFSCTKLDHQIEPPSMVSQLDWVELMWPAELKDLQSDPTNDLRRMMYPKVQKYCLMSVAGCYTDFHVDFGGTSVWYHVLKGEKLFLLIPPSLETYELFKTWHISGEQESIFFAELVSKAQLVRLTPGDTFIMPSGWIHAVYTPSDSLVFGGNFLHSFNISQQLKVAALENLTKVPLKFRYPFYGTMHWYVIERYHNQLAKLGGAGGRSTPPLLSVDQEEEDASKSLSSGAQINRKWLKGVALEKVQVRSKKCGADSAESPVLPFLSTYEREGLLSLIQQMWKCDLFMSDVPPSFTNSEEMLRELEDQLRSSNTEGICTVKPTGVGVVTPPISKCQQKIRSSSTPGKRRRKMETDCFQEGEKVMRQDNQNTKRKLTTRKRRRKPLVISLPKSVMDLSFKEERRDGGGVLDASGRSNLRGNGVVESESERVSGVEERKCGDLERQQEAELVLGSKEKDKASPVSMCGEGVITSLLTPPLSLSSAESHSMSPPPCSSPPSSPYTPTSQSFSLVLELDSPLAASTQTTPLSHQKNLFTQDHTHNSTHNTVQALDDLCTPDSSTSPSTSFPHQEQATTDTHTSL